MEHAKPRQRAQLAASRPQMQSQCPLESVCSDHELRVCLPDTRQPGSAQSCLPLETT